MKASELKTDIAIVGGGMVGATLAAALGNSQYQITVIEAYPLGSEAQPSYDDRSIALSYGSKRILEQMGLWASLQPSVEKINKIHVSDRGYFGATRIDAAEEGVEALGYVIANRDIGRVLMAYIDTLPNVQLLCPASVTDVRCEQDQVTLNVRSDAHTTINSRLLVAADGAQSALREQLGIAKTIENYQQTAVVCNVTPQRHHQNVAYERFTEEGPLAFLPLQSHEGKPRCTIVWTLSPEHAEAVLQLNDAEFLQQLQQQFGRRLGRLEKAGMRKSFPLQLTQSENVIAERAVLLGNAAQALHPVAGQGFNLALRDAGALAECLLNNDISDAGDAAVLQQYAEIRRPDQKRTISFTDTLVKIFSNKIFPFAHTRSLGLLAVDMLPFARHRFARYTMGLQSPLPRLMASSGRYSIDSQGNNDAD